MPIFTAKSPESQPLDVIAEILNRSWDDLVSLEKRCEIAEQKKEAATAVGLLKLLGRG